MPVVPGLGAGLWPLLQMTLLPPLTVWIAQWGAGRSATFAMVLDQVKKIECWLDGLPRKCVGFKTAAEVFLQNVALTG